MCAVGFDTRGFNCLTVAKKVVGWICLV